jgi:hypothetical protein
VLCGWPSSLLSLHWLTCPRDGLRMPSCRCSVLVVSFKRSSLWSWDTKRRVHTSRYGVQTRNTIDQSNHPRRNALSSEGHIDSTNTAATAMWTGTNGTKLSRTCRQFSSFVRWLAGNHDWEGVTWTHIMRHKII